MSTKTIGLGVLAAGLVTAAVSGVVLLRPPAGSIEPLTAPIAIAPPSPAPTPVPQPAVESPAMSDTRSTARAQRPPSPPPARVTTPPRAEPQDPPSPVLPTPTPSPVVEPLPATPTPVAEPVRYIPDSTPVPVLPPAFTPQFDEVKIERHSVIGIRLDHAVSSRTAKVEDRVTAIVSRAVESQGRVAVAEGARVEGTVVSVDRGGKFRERPRLGLRFDTIILTDGTRLSIETDTIFREGESPVSEATAKVGAGAVAGAIIGGIFGGKKGAAIGGAAGAAGGAATVARGDGEEVVLRAGAPLTVRLTDDLIVLVGR